MKPTIYFLMSSIGLVRGGITQASLKQASLFAEMGFDTHILTFDFNPRYPLVRQRLLELNKIHKNVKILNLYENLECISGQPAIKKTINKASIPKLTDGLPYDKRCGHNAYRVYKNGIYIKYISLNNDGSLNFIDYFNENRYRTKREVYDPWGNIRKIDFMDFALNKPRQSVFYNTKSEAYLSKWSNPKNGKVKRILSFDENLTLKKTYVNDNISIQVDWVNSIITNKSVVISDTRTTDEILLNLDNENIAKIWRLHSNHLASPYKNDSDIAPKVKNGFKDIEKFDVAVFLTEEQKNDIINQIGKKTTYTVVPHFHEVKLNTGLFKNHSKSKDNKLAVIISRFSTLKRIDHAIKAFSTVVKEVPDARLEIWGTGEQENNFKELIKELHLENNVILRGYTQNSDEVFQKGLFSLFTSKSEGFGLSCLESMSNATPVISYNIKYGPSDMIVNNENGFILKNGDIDELASKMTYLFKNPSDAIQMGNKAKEYVSDKFSKNAYREKWLRVIDLAIKNKSQ